MKYVNPEYVSIQVESNDVITTSTWTSPAVNKGNYSQSVTYEVDKEAGTVTPVSTTISADLGALGLGI